MMEKTFGNESPSLKFLSLGAGAIGTYLGGSLILAGFNVVFLEQSAMKTELEKRGLRLDLSIDRRRGRKTPSFVRPMAFQVADTIEAALRLGPFDAGLFALKSFDTADILEKLAPFKKDLPPFLCLSNGVDNEPALAAALGEDKVIAGTVTTSISRRAAGDITLEKLRGIGISAGHPISESLHEAFNSAYLNSQIYKDPASMKWSKMLTNLIANPTSAILDMTPAQIFTHNGLYHMEIEMMRECLSVMKVKGLRIIDLPRTPVRALAFATRLPVWLSKPLMVRAAGAGRGSKMPSFHIDLHSGRGKSEVEHLHGAVVRAGENFGIATPINKVLTEVLMDLTAGNIPVDQFARKPEKLIEKINQASRN